MPHKYLRHEVVVEGAGDGGVVGEGEVVVEVEGTEVWLVLEELFVVFVQPLDVAGLVEDDEVLLGED